MKSTTRPPGFHEGPRGFVYPLEAIANRKRWKLERLEREWQDARRTLQAARAELRRIEADLDRVKRLGADGHHGVLDLDRQRRLLRYLLQLQRHRDAASKSLAERQQDEAKARRCWIDLQREIDAFDRDRARCIDEHRAGLSRVDGLEADRAWTVREATALALVGKREHA